MSILTISVDQDANTWEIKDGMRLKARGHFEDGGSLTVIDKSEFAQEDLPLLLVEAVLNGEI